MTRTYSDAIDADELARQFYDEPTPEPREIPAGKILLSEYADVDDTNRARHAELETVRTPLRELRISHTSAGFEPAGSVARWTNGYYAVRWYAGDGSRHGQHTRTLEEANELAREWQERDRERADTYARVLEEQRRQELEQEHAETVDRP